MANGCGEYAIIKLEEPDKLRATIRLLASLEEGVNSAKEKEWLKLMMLKLYLIFNYCFCNIYVII